MRRLALFIALFAGASSVAHAYLVTLAFTGTLTDVDLRERSGSNMLNIDPNAPFSYNGQPLLSGDASVSGLFTFDTDVTRYAYHCPELLPTSYDLSTEGITFSKPPAVSCNDYFDVGPDGLVSHSEGPQLTQTSVLNSSIQNIVIHFADGVFTDGSFSLDYIQGGGLAGAMYGVINSVTLANVPEPGIWTLLITGMFGMRLLRKRMR